MEKIQTYHRFIDETGDMTFYNSKKEWIVGTEGVSKTFSLGMLKINEPLAEVRNRIILKQKEILENSYLNANPSVRQRLENGGFYFHACKDMPEIRMIFNEFIASLDCSFEMVVGRKIKKYYDDAEHNFSDESNFYADLLSHLLKNKLQTLSEIIINVAARGKTTSTKTMQAAVKKAEQRYLQNERHKNPIKTQIKTNIQTQFSEPILNVVDYFCWAVQRVFEKGEMRYYDYLKDKISLVIDLYDTAKYKNSRNYYDNKRNPLTVAQHIK